MEQTKTKNLKERSAKQSSVWCEYEHIHARGGERETAMDLCGDS